MPKRPSITVITPTYNRREALARAVQSVQAQTLENYEHIIVDDGSEDDTESFVRGLNDPRIHYVRFAKRHGANAARNAGVAAARTEWITFLDSDDEYLPARLATMAERLKAAGRELFLSSFQTKKRGRLRPAANPEIFLAPRELSQALVLHAIFIAGSSITVRRKALLRAGGFDERLGRMQDRDVLLRLARRCGGQLLAEVDWIKHPSADSISGASTGYVAALGALFGAHPALAGRWRDVVAYHVARRVCGDLLALRWANAWTALVENSACPALQFAWSELARGYRAGAAKRRQFKTAIVERVSTLVIERPAKHYAQRHFATPALTRAA